VGSAVQADAAHLKDDYSHDGRTVFEILDRGILPDAVEDHEHLLSRLAEAYKQINAPRGLLGRKTLTGISTKAIESDDATYAVLDEKIRDITAKRNEIAGAMLLLMSGVSRAGGRLVFHCRRHPRNGGRAQHKRNFKSV
jgi:hypothetical protein